MLKEKIRHRGKLYKDAEFNYAGYRVYAYRNLRILVDEFGHVTSDEIRVDEIPKLKGARL